jgi:hypothetical protein
MKRIPGLRKQLRSRCGAVLYNAASAAQHVIFCFILFCPLQFKEYLQRAEDIKALLNGQQPVTATPANGAQKARGPGGGPPPGGNGGGGGGGGDVSHSFAFAVYKWPYSMNRACISLTKSLHVLMSNLSQGLDNIKSLKSQVYIPTLSTSCRV